MTNKKLSKKEAISLGNAVFEQAKRYGDNGEFLGYRLHEDYTGLNFSKAVSGGYNPLVSDGGVFNNCVFPPDLKTSESFCRLDIEFNDVEAKRASFINSTLQEISARHSVFSYAKFDGADCDGYFKYCDFRKTSFKNAKLTNTVFTKCYLTDADFTGAILYGVSFHDCNLEQANFKDAKIGYCKGDNKNIFNLEYEKEGTEVVYTKYKIAINYTEASIEDWLNFTKETFPKIHAPYGRVDWWFWAEKVKPDLDKLGVFNKIKEVKNDK
jgi:hypothetical protein